MASHQVYRGAKTDPYAGGADGVRFNDNKWYLCYVTKVDPLIEVIFYQYPWPQLTIEIDTVSISNWDAYPAGTIINSIEACDLITDNLSSIVFSQDALSKIIDIATGAGITSYSWKGRGVSPPGYIKGMAVAFSKNLLQIKSRGPCSN